MKLKDERGNSYGRWTVMKRVENNNNKNRQARWLCRCECGAETVVKGGDLRNGSSQSCGCLQRERVSAACSLEKGQAAFNQLFGQYQIDAKKRSHSFELTEEEFKNLTQGNCFYCGIEPSQVLNKKYCNGTYTYNGVDRKNNAKGYEPSNCLSCCGVCNRAKYTLSFEEFLAWLARLVSQSLQRKEDR